MFINELYIYSLWIALHVFELFKNEFDKNTWLFGLKEQFSGDDFKTVRGVRIIRVFELIGNLPYALDVPRRGGSNETHNIYFHGEIRKIPILFSWKKCLICSYDQLFPMLYSHIVTMSGYETGNWHPFICLAAVSCPRHIGMILPTVTLYWIMCSTSPRVSCLIEFEFYGPVNTVKFMLSQSIYLFTPFLLAVNQYTITSL